MNEPSFEIVWWVEPIPPRTRAEALAAIIAETPIDPTFKKLGELMADEIMQRLKRPSAISRLVKPITKAK